MEMFNSSFRRELLIAYVFRNRQEVRHNPRNGCLTIKKHRPHKAINYLTPIEYENLAEKSIKIQI